MAMSSLARLDAMRPILTLLLIGSVACSSTAPDAQSESATSSVSGGAGAKPDESGGSSGMSSMARAGSTSANTGIAGQRANSANAQAGRSGSDTAGIAGSKTPSAGMIADSGKAGASASAVAGEGGQSAAAGASGAGAAGAAGSSSAPKKFVGNITTNGQVRDGFDKLWDQITPENEGKWGSVEATRNQMNWSGLDRVHDYAKMHGIVFKQHTLVWGSQQPSWLSGLSKDEQKAEVEEWIRLFCERYPDVALIDVVNEPPPHTMPVYMDALGGAGSSGYDWIVQAFKWARQYCPNATLIMNDYNNIEYGGDNSHFLDIVDRIRKAGAPIDALGAQAHDAHKQTVSTLKGFIDKLTATGLPLYITEYDIDLADDAAQQKVMMEQFPLFWDNGHIPGITLWGYVVGATWRTNTGLMTGAGMQRPALTWLVDFLHR